MPTLCFEKLPFNTRAITRRPALAMDAALPPNRELIGDDTMEHVLDLLRSQLDSETFKRVKEIITANSKMSADAGPTKRPSQAFFEGAGADFLRDHGLDEADIDHLRGLYGFSKPSVAQDSARRERDRQRDDELYATMFPTASHIVNSGEVVEEKVPRTTMDAAASETYDAMFPDAKAVSHS